MVDVKTFAGAVDAVAPFVLAEEWDNCGVILDCGAVAERALVALDVTPATIAEAAARGCGILLTHHPAMRQPQNKFTAADVVILAARHGISLVAAHTCFDSAHGGVNDVLAAVLGLRDVQPVGSMARGGALGPMDCVTFVNYVKERLGCKTVGVVPANRQIVRVAVLGGSGGSQIPDIAAEGYDAFVTGELKHHDALAAQASGICAVAAGHFVTENLAVPALCKAVQAKLGDRAQCILSTTGADPLRFV